MAQLVEVYMADGGSRASTSSQESCLSLSEDANSTCSTCPDQAQLARTPLERNPLEGMFGYESYHDSSYEDSTSDSDSDSDSAATSLHRGELYPGHFSDSEDDTKYGTTTYDFSWEKKDESEDESEDDGLNLSADVPELTEFEMMKRDPLRFIFGSDHGSDDEGCILTRPMATSLRLSEVYPGFFSDSEEEQARVGLCASKPGSAEAMSEAAGASSVEDASMTSDSESLD